MTIRIGSNIASLTAQRRLAESDTALSKTFERLSSGQRINRASDDAAVLAIVSALDADKRVSQQGIRNLNDGISALNVIEQSLAELTSITQRQMELAEQPANGIYSTKQRLSLNTEAQALADEYQRILESTEFNGIKLLDGSTSQINLQAGTGSGGILTATILQSVSSQTGSSLQGLGTFSNQYVTLTHGYNSTLLVGDFDEDGIDDIAALGFETNLFHLGVQIIEGQESGPFGISDTQTYNISAGDFGAYSIEGRVRDHDLDGHLDIEVYTNVVGPGPGYSVYPIHGTFYGDGTGATNPFVPNVPAYTDETSSLVIGDFNGDGFDDQASVSGANLTVQIQNVGLVSSSTTSTQSLSQESFSLLTQSDAREAITSLGQSLQTVQEVRSNIGASLSRVGTAINTLGAKVENIALAAGRMRDADIAFESSQLLTLQIRQNISSAILAQANQQPEIALRILSTGPP